MLLVVSVVAAPSAFAFASRTISVKQQQSLCNNRYLVVPQWLSPSAIETIQKDAVAVDAAAGFDCMVGTASKGSARLDVDVRRSRQCNLYPPPSNAAGCVQTRDALIHAVNDLRESLQASSSLQLPHLAPFSTELNYLLYPSGGHYMRHLDVPGNGLAAGER